MEDPDLLTRLADEGICLDVCPTSNVALSVVPGLHAHPLPQLLEAGVPCSINADDPLLFGMGLLDEYVVCRQALGLDDAVLASCARASIEHSGAPADQRRPCPSGHRRLVGVVGRQSRVNNRSTVVPTWARVSTGSSALATSMAASFRAARRRSARGWSG